MDYTKHPTTHQPSATTSIKPIPTQSTPQTVHFQLPASSQPLQTVHLQKAGHSLQTVHPQTGLGRQLAGFQIDHLPSLVLCLRYFQTSRRRLFGWLLLRKGHHRLWQGLQFVLQRGRRLRVCFGRRCCRRRGRLQWCQWLLLQRDPQSLPQPAWLRRGRHLLLRSALQKVPQLLVVGVIAGLQKGLSNCSRQPARRKAHHHRLAESVAAGRRKDLRLLGVVESDFAAQRGRPWMVAGLSVGRIDLLRLLESAIAGHRKVLRRSAEAAAARFAGQIGRHLWLVVGRQCLRKAQLWQLAAAVAGRKCLLFEVGAAGLFRTLWLPGLVGRRCRRRWRAC